MPKTVRKIETEPYEVEILADETRKGYAAMEEKKGDPLLDLFRTLLPTLAQESRLFLEGVGMDLRKISSVRLLSQPDENGEVLFLCNARLCGKLLRGGESVPRQSVEEAGISMVFVGEEKDFVPSAAPLSSPQVEMRFVLPLIYQENNEEKE